MTDAERHELAEAEALAQALERDTALPELPADALQTAAFLRFNAKDADLGDVAEQRIFAELSDAVQRAPQRKPRRAWLWFVPAATLGAASLLFFMRSHSAPQQEFLLSTEAPRATKAPTVTSQATHRQAVQEQESQLGAQQETLCNLAEQQLKQGQTEAALRTIADSLVLNATPSATLARVYVLKAQAHERRGETILARESYAQALEINRQLMQDSLGK